MGYWAIEHPWMTFFLVMFLISVIDDIVSNICLAISEKKYDKDRTDNDIEIKSENEL